LVSGGAGYIGSHVVRDLCTCGYRVFVIDNLSTGRPENLLGGTLIEGDIGDESLVAKTIRDNKISSLLHFAAFIQVEESVSNPAKYFENNSFKAFRLFATALKNGITSILFSSTAAVYGIPETIPVNEKCPLTPINPYGNSKMISETLLRDLVSASPDAQFVILRYFNVAGADSENRIGQVYPKPTHLITLALKTALGQRPVLSVFGTDYNTPDGTCIRDYIHIDDLSSAHILALGALERGQGNAVFNCGYGRGHSVFDVINSVNRVTGRQIPMQVCSRRPGDPPVLTADSQKIRKTLGWTPRFDDLDYIVRTAWNWEKKIEAKL
jgi:UDP-glucose 4-epimerase